MWSCVYNQRNLLLCLPPHPLTPEFLTKSH
uniref:Uncharacterized protein n=1 Tax=Anguilla anguilla TaxID=7936 RepID=A0A0E9WGF8_ANGAN